MIIGVDRLDYSKGLNLRLDAFEHFLRSYPDWRGKVTYLQITPNSRAAKFREYAEMEQMVEPERRPDQRHLWRSRLDADPLCQPRATADGARRPLSRRRASALVTPLRDGMNLVAKEFVAAQDPDDPGVLVLSRFAGAARECKEALLVNPYDTEAVAAAINRALSMPLEERQARQEALFRIVCENDIQNWPDRFLSRPLRCGKLDNAATSVRADAYPSSRLGRLPTQEHRFRDSRSLISQTFFQHARNMQRLTSGAWWRIWCRQEVPSAAHDSVMRRLAQSRQQRQFPHRERYIDGVGGIAEGARHPAAAQIRWRADIQVRHEAEHRLNRPERLERFLMAVAINERALLQRIEFSGSGGRPRTRARGIPQR